jgi:hypothetical protein
MYSVNNFIAAVPPMLLVTVATYTSTESSERPPAIWYWTGQRHCRFRRIAALVNPKGRSCLHRDDHFCFSPDCGPAAALHQRTRWARTGQRRRLFDHLIGAGEERGRHRHADLLSRLCVNRKLETRGLAEGDLGGACARQYLRDLIGCLPKRIVWIAIVGKRCSQATALRDCAR